MPNAPAITNKRIVEALEWAASQESLLDRNDYVGGYWALRSLFDDKLEFANLIDVEIGAHAVYGWMPTILKRVDLSKNKALLLFAHEWKNRKKIDWTRAKKALEGNTIDLRAINNSVVGTSKFLHFVAPEIFPIWDSRIARVFDLIDRSQINNPSNYMAYCDAVHQRLREPVDWPSFPANNDAQIVSDVRKLEFCLFAYGKQLSANPRT